MARPPLTLAGGDVALDRRLNCGRVRVVYLDRDGRRTPHGRDAWPHELRGIGWHLTDIKRAIAALDTPTAAPRPLLAAHYAAAALTNRED